MYSGTGRESSDHHSLSSSGSVEIIGEKEQKKIKNQKGTTLPPHPLQAPSTGSNSFFLFTDYHCLYPERTRCGFSMGFPDNNRRVIYLGVARRCSVRNSRVCTVSR